MSTRLSGLDGWYDSGDGLLAWFAATSHTHAATLVAPALEAAGGDHPWPALDVRRTGVRVRLSAHTADAAGLAGTISTAAERLGLTPSPDGARSLAVRVRSSAPDRLAPFWRTVLHHDLRGGGRRLADPLTRRPDLLLASDDEVGPLRDRFHLDVGHPGPVTEAIASALATGGTERFACEWYSTIGDPDGNEVDLVPGGPLDDAPEVADWRALFGGMTCYLGATAEQAARLAEAAAAHAEEAGLPLLVDVRPDGVVLDSGKDRWERPGFLPLAARVQAAARALGLTAEPGRLRFTQVGLDAAEIAAVRAFWGAVLGYDEAADPRITDLLDPHDLDPVVFLQDLADEPERRRQRNRIRLLLRLPADGVAARVDAALAHGGRRLDDRTLVDPEGNELELEALAPARAL